MSWAAKGSEAGRLGRRIAEWRVVWSTRKTRSPARWRRWSTCCTTARRRPALSSPLHPALSSIVRASGWGAEGGGASRWEGVLNSSTATSWLMSGGRRGFAREEGTGGRCPGASSWGKKRSQRRSGRRRSEGGTDELTMAVRESAACSSGSMGESRQSGRVDRRWRQQQGRHLS